VIQGGGIMHVEAGAFWMRETPQRATSRRHHGHRDHRFIAFRCAISEDLGGR
jgi:hypothetical protein